MGMLPNAFTSLLYLATILVFLGCSKKDEQKSTAAAVVEQSSSSTVVRLEANLAQSLSIASGDLAGAGFQVPEGSLAESMELHIRVGTSLNHEFLPATYDQSENFKVIKIGPAVEFRPRPHVVSSKDITIFIPKGDVDVTDNLAVLYKGIDDEGIWKSALIGSGYLADHGTTVSFKAKSFGRFQLVSLESDMNNNMSSVNEGSGPWYGSETELYSQFLSPDLDGPDHVFYLFDHKGSISLSQSNGEVVSPPPSFDFPSLLTESPNVFDASGNVQVSLALYTSDFDYGFWVDFRTNEQLLTTRVIQREDAQALPSSAFDIKNFSGSYTGLTATTKISGFGSSYDSSYLDDALQLEVSDNTISLTGSLKATAVDAGSLALVSTPVGSNLGFFKGNLTVGSKTYVSYLIPSINGKAFGLIVCDGAEGGACPVGDGSGTYEARSMFFGVFQRD